MLPITKCDKIVNFNMFRNGTYSNLMNMYVTILYGLGNGIQFRVNNPRYEECFEKFWHDTPYQENMTTVNDYTIWAASRHCSKQYASVVVPELGITLDQTNFEKLKKIVDVVWRLNKETQNIVQITREKIKLPPAFCGIHIRRGDKMGTEMEYIPTSKYVEKYQEVGKNLPIFIATDDYQVIDEFKQLTNSVIYYVAQPTQIGHNKSPHYNSQDKEGQQQLCTEVDFLCASEVFIGTYSSNLSRFIPLRHKDPNQCFSLDAPWGIVW